MQQLVEGIHQVQNGIFNSEQRVFEGPVEGQHPLSWFITCSDWNKLYGSIGHPRVAAHLGNIVMNRTRESSAHHREPMWF